jgi:hypothetical protein
MTEVFEGPWADVRGPGSVGVLLQPATDTAPKIAPMTTFVLKTLIMAFCLSL